LGETPGIDAGHGNGIKRGVVSGVVFKNRLGIDRAEICNAKIQFLGTALNNETTPVDPVRVSTHGARRVDGLAVRIAANPCLVQLLKRSVLGLQPLMKLIDGGVAIAIEKLLWIGPDVPLPSGFDVGLVPTVVGVQAAVRAAEFSQFTKVAGCGFANRRPIPTESRPATSHVVPAALHTPGYARCIDVPTFRMFLLKPPGSAFENGTQKNPDSEFIAIAHHFVDVIEDEAVGFGIVVVPTRVDANDIELIFMSDLFEH